MVLSTAPIKKSNKKKEKKKIKVKIKVIEGGGTNFILALPSQALLSTGGGTGATAGGG